MTLFEFIGNDYDPNEIPITGLHGMNMELDINGNRVAKSKFNNPYDYSPFRIFVRNHKNSDEVVYSDRLRQWNSERYRELLSKWFGNTSDNFSNRYPEQIQKFLSDYFEKRILLTGIEQACNVGNGYPYWIFYFRIIGDDANEKAEV